MKTGVENLNQANQIFIGNGDITLYIKLISNLQICLKTKYFTILLEPFLYQRLAKCKADSDTY